MSKADEMIKEIIISTIKSETHLGDNLKMLCIEYIEQLEDIAKTTR